LDAFAHNNNQACASLCRTAVLEDHGIVQEATETAFAVCGFGDFDEDANLKPTMGARLVRINGTPVDGCWTLKELHEALDPTEVKIQSLTFRNEIWDRKQSSMLRTAIKARTCNSDHTDQCRADHSLSRTRTRSGDSVGKALNGFNNFLQNLHHNHHNQAPDHERKIPFDCRKESSQSQKCMVPVMMEPKKNCAANDSNTCCVDTKIDPNVGVINKQVDSNSPSLPNVIEIDEAIVIAENTEQQQVTHSSEDVNNTTNEHDVTMRDQVLTAKKTNEWYHHGTVEASHNPEVDETTKVTVTNGVKQDTKDFSVGRLETTRAKQEQIEAHRETADKIMSSMKNMGKLFGMG
jgi:hypothetical protein